MGCIIRCHLNLGTLRCKKVNWSILTSQTVPQTPPLPGQHQGKEFSKGSAQQVFVQLNFKDHYVLMLNSRLHQAHGYPGDSSSTSSAFTYTQGQGSNPSRTSQNAVLTVLTFQAILMNDYGSFKKRISSFIREYQTGLFLRSRTNHCSYQHRS